MTTLGSLYHEIHALLQHSHIEESRINTEWILWDLLNLNHRSEIYLKAENQITETIYQQALSTAQKRAQHIPLQYLIKSTEFYSIPFEISPDCLIPRPETEELVGVAIHWLEGQSQDSYRVLDIGTGSGNIAIALAKNIPNSKIMAVDISRDALIVAEKNIQTHKLSSQITLLVSNLTEALSKDDVFDLVVSNPPYIDEEDYSSLQPEVRDHEPRKALWGGKNGLEVIERLLNTAPAYLRQGGAFLMEFGGSKQTPKLLSLLERTKTLHKIEILKDMSGSDRILKATRCANG